MIYTINEEVFFAGYRRYFESSIPQEQVEDLQFIIKKLNDSTKITAEDLELLKEKYACVFATIYWETARTFDPITERGTMRYLMSKRYYPYVGRGYVQLTWLDGYRRFGNFLGLDLVGKPYLANEPETAWLILEEGMTRNWDVKRQEDPNFTAYTMDEVFNEDTFAGSTRYERFLQSRRIINGVDQRIAIANICEQFYKCIEFKEAA